MRRTVIVVRTANRPEILNRCLAAAVEGCDVARDAYWLVLDDSCLGDRVSTREIVDSWKRLGLRLSYIDKSVEEQVADSLPESESRSSFTRLVARSASSPTDNGRNLGLIAGLSLSPDMVFFMDDDMVHRHEENCFFHWCANSCRPDNFIAAPLRLGIIDMAYLDRLVRLLDRDDWLRFVSDAGISSDPASWYSSRNPFWEQEKIEKGREPMIVEKDVVSGQIMALGNHGGEWLAFPGGFNADINWSILQSTCLRTALLWVSGFNAQHLPPCLGHPKAEAILSEVVGTAITRALLQIESGGELPMDELAARLPDLLRRELKRGVLLFMDVERAVVSRLHSGHERNDGTIAMIRNTLTDVAERLKSLDSRELASKWLEDFATRRSMFLELHRDEIVQREIRRIIFGADI